MHKDNSELQPKISCILAEKKRIRSFIKMEIFKNKTAVSASNWHIFLKKSTKSILPNSRSLTNIYKVSLIFM